MAVYFILDSGYCVFCLLFVVSMPGIDLMPYTLKQHKLFEYVKHNPEQAHAKGIKIKQSDASKMASEGVKHEKDGKTAKKAR